MTEEAQLHKPAGAEPTDVCKNKTVPTSCKLQGFAFKHTAQAHKRAVHKHIL